MRTGMGGGRKDDVELKAHYPRPRQTQLPRNFSCLVKQTYKPLMPIFSAVIRVRCLDTFS